MTRRPGRLSSAHRFSRAFREWLIEVQSQPITPLDELRRRIVENSDDVAGFLYRAYSVLRQVHNQGDWDADYYKPAAELWDQLGTWMYPGSIRL